MGAHADAQACQRLVQAVQITLESVEIQQQRWRIHFG